ncbi:MAG: aldehyde dehydrogenase family protein [Paracoccaceae bacterium]
MPAIKDIMQTMEYGPAPESDAEVNSWLKGHKQGIGHFISGKFSALGDASSDVVNPANGGKIALLAKAGSNDVNAAVGAARKAFASWSALPGHERAKYMYAIARHIQKKSRFFSVLETVDNGKTIRESRDIDIPLVARHFYHHAGWAELLESEFPDHKPLGVCGQVIPWNFPLLMLAWKVAPALAAGNTIVLKPADLTPLTAHAFAEICVEIGLPKGVFNIVHGDRETGALVTGHPDVNKVAFTGSTAVGRRIRQQVAGSGKKISLELGGKSPFIVFEDADIDAAVEGVVDAIWFNQGEVCCAGSRILVQEGIAAGFFKKLTARMNKLRIGDPLDKCNDVGAIASAQQLSRINTLVAQGEAEGATLVRSTTPMPTIGSYCAPGFFTGTNTAHKVVQEEIFGPIAVTMTFRTPDEAVTLANNTRYGLAASVWSENINRAVDVAARIKAGVIWINGTNMFDAGAAFGGYRESGFGREGAREGLLEYLTEKAVRNTKPRPAPSVQIDTRSKVVPIEGHDIDVTAKLFLGGKQVRADSGYSYAVTTNGGKLIGHAALANRKDVRNAVEAARNAKGWGAVTGHNRAQVLYFFAENLNQRRNEFVDMLAGDVGLKPKDAAQQFEASVRRCFWYAAQADKFDGAVHSTNSNHITLAINEPWGTVGIVCPDEAPLLSMISLFMPALAMGNAVVAIAAQSHPLVAAKLYQVVETSDIPAGVLNLLTGERDSLAKTLALHDGLDCLWYCGSAEGEKTVELASAGNLKPVWSDRGLSCDWMDNTQGQGRHFLRRATQIKTIWLPYGD